MLRFHDVQELGNAGDDAVMVARGPFDAAEEQVIEICVWVFQRGDNDAAATEMTTGRRTTTPATTTTSPSTRTTRAATAGTWRCVRSAPFRLTAGDAFGVAVAMLKMKNEDDAQRVVWWGHPLKLNDPSGAAEGPADTEKRAY